MKNKIITIIFIVVFVIVSFASMSMIEYYYAQKNNRLPFFAIRLENKSKQYYGYNALFYKVYKCYSNDIYVKGYKDKISCPNLILFDEDNNYTTPNNLTISKYDYQIILNKVYTYKEIDLLTNYKDITNAVILASEYGKSKSEKSSIEYTHMSEKIDVNVFNNFVVIDPYGNYGWVAQFNNSNYYKCVKKDDKGFNMYSEYKNNSCSEEWKYYEYSDKWCELAKNSNIDEFIEEALKNCN